MLITTDYRCLDAGWPGSTHDARVLRNSPLFMEAEAGRKFAASHYIIGDTAYPLRPWLVTGFRYNGHLNDHQKRLNYVLSSRRQTVERCIGHLKGRFRKLREIHLYDLETVCKVIFAGCILHNLCVLEDDNVEEYIEENLNDHPNQYPPIFPNNNDANTHRNNLLRSVCNF